MEELAYTSGVLVDGVGPLVGAGELHFVDDDLFGAEDDAIAAYYSQNCAKFIN